MKQKHHIHALKGKSVKTSKHGTILELHEIEYNDEYVFKAMWVKRLSRLHQKRHLRMIPPQIIHRSDL